MLVGQCENGYSYWIQPQLEIPVTNEAQEVNAYCYPTAAASLLAYYKDKWNSRHFKNYPQTYNEVNLNENKDTIIKRNVTFDSNPWLDYTFHVDDTLNLGHYTKTKKNVGTTLQDGARGCKDF